MIPSFENVSSIIQRNISIKVWTAIVEVPKVSKKLKTKKSKLETVTLDSSEQDIWTSGPLDSNDKTKDSESEVRDELMSDERPKTSPGGGDQIEDSVLETERQRLAKAAHALDLDVDMEDRDKPAKKKTKLSTLGNLFSITSLYTLIYLPSTSSFASWHACVFAKHVSNPDGAKRLTYGDGLGQYCPAANSHLGRSSAIRDATP